MLFAEALSVAHGAAFLAGGAGVAAVALMQNRGKLSAAERRAAEIVEQGRRDGEAAKKQALLDAKEAALGEREVRLREVEVRRGEVAAAERGVEKRERLVEQQAGNVAKREKIAEDARRKATEATELAEKRRKLLDRALEEQRELLLKITGLDRSQAERLLLQRLEGDLEEELGRRVARHETRVKEESERRAREILATAVQRFAAGHTAETTVSAVSLPNDEVKGRIIGREGRNIRAFEKATGVDVLVDDTPGVVMVSGFDGVRREIARMALERLVADGRIHPARIEEAAAAAKDEIDARILQLGRAAAEEAGVDRLHERLVQRLGQLQFRTSYSQNVLRHSVEVALLCGLLADEMGFDAALARRCGLLHDVGKAIDHEQEGGHPKLGMELAQRCGEEETVLHAIGGHHDDLRVDRIYTVLVAAADAISASRPGARRESLDKYISRLKDLEALCLEFDGVQAAYAIQAGREVRVIADADKATDAAAEKLARDISQAIEARLQYPGEIRVTVLRETRFVEHAR